MTAQTTIFTVSRYRLLRSALIVLFGVALLAGAVAVETRIFDPGVSGSHTAEVRRVSDGTIVSGATATFDRGEDGIDATLNTTGLPTGHVIIVKALIFNNPRACTHPAAGARCGVDDLSAPGVDGSIVFTQGFFLRQVGAVNVSARISTGDKAKALVGDGLTDPLGAEVQLVVVDHGAPIAGLYSDQISTIGGGCTDAPTGGGAPGPNTCADLQFAASPTESN